MTDAQKLEALVRRAVENGKWNAELIKVDPEYFILRTWKGHEDNSRQDAWRPMEILFNHDFARALFPGNSPVVTYTLNDETKETVGVPLPSFEYHLQQAVISKNPIDYMYKAVFGD